MSEHYVDIIESASGNTIKSLGPYSSDRLAEKAERGVSHQVDIARYHTRLRHGTAPDLTPSELAEVTRFGIHEEDQEEKR